MGEIILEPKYDGITNLDPNNLILIQGESFGNYCISESTVIEPIFLSIITLLLLIQPDVGQIILLVASWSSLIFVSGFGMIFLILILFLIIIKSMKY